MIFIVFSIYNTALNSQRKKDTNKDLFYNAMNPSMLENSHIYVSKLGNPFSLGSNKSIKYDENGLYIEISWGKHTDKVSQYLIWSNFFKKDKSFVKYRLM